MTQSPPNLIDDQYKFDLEDELRLKPEHLPSEEHRELVGNSRLFENDVEVADEDSIFCVLERLWDIDENEPLYRILSVDNDRTTDYYAETVHERFELAGDR